MAALSVASYWAGRSQKDPVQLPIEGLDTHLDYALEDFEMRIFDPQGEPSVNLIAPGLTTDAASGVSNIENPAIEFIHDEELWNIVAKSATVGADREQILLTGDVWMRRAETTLAGTLDINTSEMTLAVTPRTAESDWPVRMVDSRDIMEAIGFRVDIKDNTFQLLNQVKITYAVN